METWKVTALILCGVGLFKEFRPSENYLTDYLVEYKKYSLDDLVHIAFPVVTYSYLATLFIVFLVTDFLRYRIVIIIGGFAFVATYVLMIWGTTLTSFIVVEAIFGVTMSSEVAYYTYIYAKVDKEHYKKVTAYTYTAIFMGRLLAAVIGQTLVSLDLMNYHQMNFLTLTSGSISLLLALFLPKVRDSIYFHRGHGHKGQLTSGPSSSSSVISTGQEGSFGTFDRSTQASPVSFSSKVRSSVPLLVSHFKSAYTNAYVLKWSIWWAIASAGHIQVVNYIQALWIVTVQDGGGSNKYNAAADVILCALSGAGAMGVSYLTVSWKKWSEISITIISGLMAVLLVFISRTNDMYYSYAGYIIFRTLFQVNLTIASAEISEQIEEDSHGLVFGVNTFLALSLQTILIVIVTDQSGLALSERSQFMLLGIGFAVLGLAFLVAAIFRLISFLRNRSSSETNLVSVS